MKVNVRVILAITIAVISVWAGAAANLDTIFGATASKLIVAVCNLLTASLAAVMGVLSTQSSQVGALTNIEGVTRVLVNAQASPSIAAMAMDKSNNKVVAAPGTESEVAAVAAKA